MHTKTLEFTKTLPDSEGQYLIEWKSLGFEVISVYFRPAEDRYGLHWDAGLFISSWNGKHVSRINLDMMKGIAKL